MRKILAALMATTLVVSFAGCQAKPDNTPLTSETESTTLTGAGETTSSESSSQNQSTADTTTLSITSSIPDTTSENKTTTNTQHIHKYSKKTISPTCESEGYIQYACSCGHTYKDNYVNAIGHNWNDATCTSAKTCKNCGKVDGEPLTHNYVNGLCTYCNCYDYLYVELAQDGFKYLETKYGVTTYDVVSMTGGEIDGSPAVMLYYKRDAKYFTYNDVTGRITAWSIGNVEYTEYFRMDVKSILGE